MEGSTRSDSKMNKSKNIIKVVKECVVINLNRRKNVTKNMTFRK